jgi:hypothetical protein
MPMMPPDSDLKKHLANRRSLAEAQAAYFASRNRAQLQGEARDFRGLREDIVHQGIDQMIATDDASGETAWRRVVAVARASAKRARRQ